MTKKTTMKETTVFREIDEMLAGVHGELTDDEIIDRVAALVAQAEPKMPVAALVGPPCPMVPRPPARHALSRVCLEGGGSGNAAGPVDRGL